MKLKNIEKICASAVMIFAFALLAGCVGSKVVWVQKESVAEGEVGGNYVFVSADARVLPFNAKKVSEELAKSVKDTGEVALPIRVSVEDHGKRDDNGVLASINNVFSICTLGIWPYVQSYEQTVDFKVTSPTDEKEQKIVFGGREWNSFILPIAVFPCPGWGDWRGRSSDDTDRDFCKDYEAKAVADLLSKDFYAESSKKYNTALCQISKSVENSPRTDLNEDMRPIFLVDPKDVHVRCEGEGAVINVEGIMDLMEDCLKDTDLCRVVTKKSVERSLKEQALFAALTGEGDGVAQIAAPAYRVELSIERYKFKDETKLVSQTRKHTFKKKSVWNAAVQTVAADVQIVIKVVDLKTGLLCLSENLHGECSDKKIAQTFSSRKGEESDGGKMLSTSEKYLHAAIGQIMEKFANSVKKMQKFSIVSCTKDGVLTIDGTDRVFSVGEHVSLLKLGDARVSQRTGRTTQSETCVAKAVVINTSSSGTDLRIETILDPNITGDVIVRK